MEGVLLLQPLQLIQHVYQIEQQYSRVSPDQMEPVSFTKKKNHEVEDCNTSNQTLKVTNDDGERRCDEDHVNICLLLNVPQLDLWLESELKEMAQNVGNQHVCAKLFWEWI